MTIQYEQVGRPGQEAIFPHPPGLLTANFLFLTHPKDLHSPTSQWCSCADGYLKVRNRKIRNMNHTSKMLTDVSKEEPSLRLKPTAPARFWCLTGLAWLIALASAAQAAAPESRLWQVSTQTYSVPTIKLVGADGIARPLSKALGDGRLVVMTFMYSSCTTVCPIVNQTMVQFEQMLAAERPKVNTVSISIDPTHDTVQKLAEYAKRSGAAGAFYTGDPAASEHVQRTFNVWRGGDKMNHKPVFLLKAPGAAAWVRVDGLITPAELLRIYKQVASNRMPAV